MITYDMLCIVYNCLWESAKTRSFKTRKEWGYRWDAFKSAGNGILSLRQELLVVQNGKRQLVLYLYIIYDSINKDCIPLENTSRTSGINVKSKSVKPTLRKLCTHLFDDLPSHFCLKNVFGNILNRGQTKNCEEGVYACPRTSLESSVWRRLLQYLFSPLPGLITLQGSAWITLQGLHLNWHLG